MKRFMEWLKKIFKLLFKYTFIVLEQKDGTYKMNLWNPLSYVALFVVAVIAGVWDGFLSFWILIKQTIKESK